MLNGGGSGCEGRSGTDRDCGLQAQPLPAKPVSKAQHDGPSREDLEGRILGVVQSLIGNDVKVDEPLSKQGLDSLAAMELRQKLQVPLFMGDCDV